MSDIQSMLGKEVEVIANGTTYRGVLIEVSDVDVHIRTSMQWVSLPASSVSEVRLAGEVKRETERDGILPGGNNTP